MSRHFALIPAAGAGSRMASEIPKQYLPLAGRPLIHHTLSAFASHPAIAAVWLVIAPDDPYWDDLALGDYGGRLRLARCGGATRAQSVANGLAAMDAAADDWVLVHDAARPCIDRDMLDRLIGQVGDDPVGGLLALPVADTLKRADATGRVARTEARDGLWQAQTPQMFRLGALAGALATLAETPTDEARAMEAAGHAPLLVAGDPRNLKVTYPADLTLAELIIGSRACAA